MNNRYKKANTTDYKPDDVESGLSLFTTLKNFFNFDSNQYQKYQAANQTESYESEDSLGDSSDIEVNDDLIYTNFLDFRAKTVAKIMIPRSDIRAVNLEAPESKVLSTILNECHTRTLVYQDSMDNIVGFINIKDLFCTIAQNEPINLKTLIRKHILVVPSMKLTNVLAEMRKRKTHIAVVVDEYGGTDGIITIEDIIGELVGKIDDEHNTDQVDSEMLKIINANTIICNARVEIEKIEKTLSVMLKKSNDYFETVGGLILARTGYFPKAGTIVAIDDNVFAEIIEANARSIKTVKLLFR
ncbi:MAG: CBS domain-containing protein [Alphaproteobacteria bacterium]|nr:CBS domain-containing protein [Alphaproteobacteria bacterium]